MKKSKLIWSILFIISVIGFFISSIVSFSVYDLNKIEPQQFSLASVTAWIPLYWRAECVERPESMELKTMTSHTDDPTMYSCTTQESKTHIPNYPGVSCEYTISDYQFASVYVCDVEYDSQGKIIGNKPLNEKDSRCVQAKSYLSTASSETFKVPGGDYIYINTDNIIGSGNLKVRYPSYGLKVVQQDNFQTITSNTCELNSVNGVELHTLDANNQKFVKPTIPFNAVSGSVQARSSQLVNLDNVESGDTIYITRPGYYSKVRTAEDGFLFVDSKQEFADEDIQCIPGTTGCSNDAKIIPLEDQTCSEFSGVIKNYAPVEGNNDKLCKYTCESGKLELSNDCISVPSTCPVDKPLFDPNRGECVAVISNVNDEPDKETNWIPAIAIALTVLLGIVSRKKSVEG